MDRPTTTPPSTHPQTQTPTQTSPNNNQRRPNTAPPTSSTSSKILPKNTPLVRELTATNVETSARMHLYPPPPLPPPLIDGTTTRRSLRTPNYTEGMGNFYGRNVGPTRALGGGGGGGEEEGGDALDGLSELVPGLADHRVVKWELVGDVSSTTLLDSNTVQPSPPPPAAVVEEEGGGVSGNTHDEKQQAVKDALDEHHNPDIPNVDSMITRLSINDTDDDDAHKQQHYQQHQHQQHQSPHTTKLNQPLTDIQEDKSNGTASSYESYEQEQQRKRASMTDANPKNNQQAIQESSSSSSGSTMAKTHSSNGERDAAEQDLGTLLDSVHDTTAATAVAGAVEGAVAAPSPPYPRHSSTPRSNDQTPPQPVRENCQMKTVSLSIPNLPNPNNNNNNNNTHTPITKSNTTTSSSSSSYPSLTKRTITLPPMTLPNFIPAINCTNATDFLVRCFVARLRSGITVVKHGRSRFCKSRLRVLYIQTDGKSLSWKPADGEPTSSKRPPCLDLTKCVEVRHAWTLDREFNTTTGGGSSSSSSSSSSVGGGAGSSSLGSTTTTTTDTNRGTNITNGTNHTGPRFTGTANLRRKCEDVYAFKSFSLIFPWRTVDITAVSADSCKVLMEGFTALCYRLQLALNGGAGGGGGGGDASQGGGVVSGSSGVGDGVREQEGGGGGGDEVQRAACGTPLENGDVSHSGSGCTKVPYNPKIKKKEDERR